MSTEVAIGEMTCFEAAEDGSSVRLGMEDVAGRPVWLRMPVDCLNRLIMTLPGVIKQAVQRRYSDPTLRIVYPAAQLQVELASDFKTRILTLETPDGFSVSFGLSEEQCRAIGADSMGDFPPRPLPN